MPRSISTTRVHSFPIGPKPPCWPSRYANLIMACRSNVCSTRPALPSRRTTGPRRLTPIGRSRRSGPDHAPAVQGRQTAERLLALLSAITAQLDAPHRLDVATRCRPGPRADPPRAGKPNRPARNWPLGLLNSGTRWSATPDRSRFGSSPTARQKYRSGESVGSERSSRS